MSDQKSAAQTITNSFPLFFTNPQLITLERHANAAVRKDIGMEFSRNVNAIPLTLADIPQSAKYYPIVFSLGKEITPLAVVGLEHQNYFVTPEGKWQEGAYVPYYIRKYPFIFIEDQANNKLSLGIEENELVKDDKTEGHKIYDNGHPSIYTNNALEFAAVYNEQHRYTRDFCEELKQQNMFLEQNSDIELANGRRLQMRGFQVINLDVFKRLPDDLALDWYKRSILEFIFYIIQSHTNWSNLLQQANKRESSA